MSSLEERGEGFEKKFAHDEELKFKAEARRNKLLGVWAAEQLGKDDAEAYAKEVIIAGFFKVRGDFDAAGVSVSDDDIRNKMSELLAKAVEQIQSE